MQILLIIIFFIVLICVGYFFNPIYCSIGRHFQLTPNQPSRWEFIKSLAYLVGLIFLGVQISISNRRAKAAEKTAEVQLQSNIETRYNNAMENLLKRNSLGCVGAIYSLYHISKISDKYDFTIFDIFTEKLKTLCSKNIDDENNGKSEKWKRTKQLIIDKLFREEDGKRVCEKNDLEIDLAKLDLSGIDFTGAKLINADLGESICDDTFFQKTNLTGADLTGADLTGCKSMNKAILNKVKAYSGTNLQGLQLKEASLKDIKFFSVNLENANLIKANLERAVLEGCNLKGVNLKGHLTDTNLKRADLTSANLIDTKGLTFEQLIMAKCLHQIAGLENNLYKKLNKENPKLFVLNTS